MNAPFQSSMGLIPLNFKQHLPPGSPPDTTRGSRWVVANLPPASARFSLPDLQRCPKSPPTPTPRYPFTSAPAPRCSLPTKLSASLPGEDFAALSRMAGAGGGEDRAAATVAPAAAPRLPLRLPHATWENRATRLHTRPGNCPLGRIGGLLLTKYVTMWASFCLTAPQ